ncbi:hypothetical protein [Pleionea mediterranea]|uniref:Uncharacterized protein n=1 Tax=Pleionea mediterranea TaxID=523701 RepID=A0A316FRQ4_9GAMM|nr:hypothetical protein [Pleionea mediterranea]PWK50852.1 hypothetical protein C8D97_106140 [Pleionea mediterranea]
MQSDAPAIQSFIGITPKAVTSFTGTFISKTTFAKTSINDWSIP